MDVELASWIKKATGALDVRRGDRIQSLWSGYGELIRVYLTHRDSEPKSAILKWARPPASAGGVSHARKVRSYEVETAFYETVANECDDHCRVARLLGARKGEREWILLLEDLDAAGFGARDSYPRGESLDACLAWLAAFHARFLGRSRDGLWRVGTYWHLDTRREELANIRDARLRDAAPRLDRELREAKFETLVHGDAKPDNFCFSADGRRVAAVDFQYVGGGVGVKDVAYLLHRERDEERALDHYFERLRSRLPMTADRDALEAEWRRLYPIAVQDFERFLAGWRR